MLHSLIMWLIISSLSLHSLHLLFCCILSILSLIWLVLMVLSCAAIKRYSVSLLRFPFLSQVQVFWCEMLFMSRLNAHLVVFFSLFLFPSCSHSFVYGVVNIVSNGCNQSSFVFFYVLLLLLLLLSFYVSHTITSKLLVLQRIYWNYITMS